MTTTTGFCTASFFRVPSKASGVIVFADAADAARAEELKAFTSDMRTQFNNESLFDLSKDEGVTLVCRNRHCGKTNRRGPCCVELKQTRCPKCGEQGRSKGCGSCAACCEGCCPLTNSTKSSATSSTKGKRGRCE